MSNSATRTFQKIKWRWQLIKSTEILLLSTFSSTFLLILLSFFITDEFTKWLLSGSLFVLLVLIFAYRTRLFKVSKNDVAQYLNRHFTQLENSTELLLRDTYTLSVIEYIQKNRVEKKLAEVLPKVQIPHRLIRYFMIFLLAVLTWIFLPYNTYIEPSTSGTLTTTSDIFADHDSIGSSLPAEISSAAILINPPSYTRKESVLSKEMNLNIPENSLVKWSFTFSDSIKNAFIVFENGDTLSMLKDNEGYSLSSRLKHDGFYNIVFIAGNNDTLQSSYYAIKIQYDQPPLVSIKIPQQYLDIPYERDSKFNLLVESSDDYGLTSAYIVATVSRGSGEAVKFREQRLFFDNKLEGNPQSSILRRSIELVDLEMGPGDELYYYVVVSDNKEPMANTARTETYFITIPDTANTEITTEAGLGVDQMPEYFRSQRQIIIDTEKIIKDQPLLSKKDYQEKLNDLGIDQKLLRLRYGQFLGEEYESGITEELEVIISSENEKSHHDGEDEEERAEGKQDHAHQHEETPDNRPLLDAYMHIHDYQGEATFFDDAIRAQLKAALSQMWEAELRLRTFRPKEALPFEYKALRLIKDIQQKSRVYVERIGFEPPVLKPQENRLSGDLSEVESKGRQNQLEHEDLFPEMSAALSAVNIILQDNPRQFSYDKNLIARAGQELAGLAVKEPGKYLKSLPSFRILVNEDISEKETKYHLEVIRTAMYKAMPFPKESPYKIETPQSELVWLFQKELTKENSDE